MLIDETVMKALKELEEETHKIVNSNNLSNKKLESYLVKLEQKRFIILERLKINNKILDGYENEIKTINSKYKCDMKNGIIKIYIPETIPYYKNNNTYAYKNILLNLIDVLEMIADCVCAGMARSGEIRDLEINPDILNRAVQNTAKLIKDMIIVEEL